MPPHRWHTVCPVSRTTSGAKPSSTSLSLPSSVNSFSANSSSGSNPWSSSPSSARSSRGNSFGPPSSVTGSSAQAYASGIRGGGELAHALPQLCHHSLGYLVPADCQPVGQHPAPTL